MHTAFLVVKKCKMFQNRYCKNPFLTAVETRSEREREKKRERGNDREVQPTRQTQISHSAPSIMNSVLPLPSRSTRSLTRETEGDWDETKGNSHINYTHSLGGSNHQRVTEAPTERWRDRGRQKNGDDNACGVPQCLRWEGVFVLSRKTPAGCWVMSQCY